MGAQHGQCSTSANCPRLLPVGGTGCPSGCWRVWRVDTGWWPGDFIIWVFYCMINQTWLTFIYFILLLSLPSSSLLSFSSSPGDGRVLPGGGSGARRPVFPLLGGADQSAGTSIMSSLSPGRRAARQPPPPIPASRLHDARLRRREASCCSCAGEL